MTQIFSHEFDNALGHSFIFDQIKKIVLNNSKLRLQTIYLSILQRHVAGP